MSAPLPRGHLGAADETTIVIAAMSGDDEAFGELVRRRQEWLRRLLRRLCRDPGEADDLAQQAFLQAWRALRTLKAPGAFGGWLRALAINLWLQQRRRARPEHAGAEAQLIDPAHEPAHEPALSAQLDLDHALGELRPAVRACIVLAYAERMSHEEISAATGLPLGTVKSHIARGAERLRALLQAYA
jgi:RNA polymerase sigma factor (sigma-70 family)